MSTPAVYREEHPSAGWVLSVATHAPPRSQKLSLGGFRIVPHELADEPGYDNDRQAIGLATGMEGKIRWSRIVRVGGPLTLRSIDRVVGGKCVLCPSGDSRVGQPRDLEMLEWAAGCMKEMESRYGFHIVTGQDLGHGTLSDTRTESLQYLHSLFPGSMVSDTSRPTGEGNFHVLKGMIAAFDIPLSGARVGLIGCGHIGTHVLERLLGEGAHVVAMDSSDERRRAIASLGVRVLTPAQKPEMLQIPLDALVVNANKRSLDSETVTRIIANDSIRVVCGSENEAMPNAADAERLRVAGKGYCPTEFGGMMGYLTAAEEYLHQLEGSQFELATMMRAAESLEPVAEKIVRRQITSGFAERFSDAAERSAGMLSS